MTASAPLELHRATIRPEWVDGNRHVNVAYHVVIFDHVTDSLLDRIGLDKAGREVHGGSVFIAEAHMTYQREVVEGGSVVMTTQILSHGEKRLHFLRRMQHVESEKTIATGEWVGLYVDLALRDATVMPKPIRTAVADLVESHRHPPWPNEAACAIR